jgi:hypothetical protein
MPFYVVLEAHGWPLLAGTIPRGSKVTRQTRSTKQTSIRTVDEAYV